jgi:hypothetical protein
MIFFSCPLNLFACDFEQGTPISLLANGPQERLLLPRERGLGARE